MRISDWSSDVCSSDLDLVQQYGHYMHMLNVAMTRGAQQEGRPLPTLDDWFGLLAAQTRNAPAWQRLFAHYDPVIAPAWGTTAFPHVYPPITQRPPDSVGRGPKLRTQPLRPSSERAPIRDK